MAEDRRGMGRGLAAILPRASGEADGLREIPVDLIAPNPRQPRRSFDEDKLGELAESIRARGVLQPIVARPLPGGRYEVVAGERRLRAARIAELDAIPAVVRETEDWERLDLALAENMARQDLNAVEEARACAMLVDDLGLTKEEVGRRVGRSRVAISNLIRLLALPEETLELIETGRAERGARPRAAALQGPRHPPEPRLLGARRRLVGARDRAPRARGAAERSRSPAAAGGGASRPRRGARRRRRRSLGRARSRRQGPRRGASAAWSSSTSSSPPRRSSWRTRSSARRPGERRRALFGSPRPAAAKLAREGD